MHFNGAEIRISNSSVLSCVLVTVTRLLLTGFLTMAAEVISDGNTRKGEL